MRKRQIYKAHPRGWRTLLSRASSSRVYHTSYLVSVRRPACLDWASFRPHLTMTPLPFSLPSAPLIPGVRTSTSQALCHARHTRLKSAVAVSHPLDFLVMPWLPSVLNFLYGSQESPILYRSSCQAYRVFRCVEGQLPQHQWMDLSKENAIHLLS